MDGLEIGIEEPSESGVILSQLSSNA